MKPLDQGYTAIRSEPAADWTRTRRTERLLLQPPSIETDRAAHLALFAHPDAVRHRPDPSPLGEEASDAKLGRDLAHWRNHGFGRWTLRALDGRIVGFGGVTEPKACNGFADALNLSYHLHPAEWGKGFATEMARAALAFAFEELQAQHVIGLARPWNPGSVRVLEQIGMTFRREIELGGARTLLHAISRRPQAYR